MTTLWKRARLARQRKLNHRYGLPDRELPSFTKKWTKARRKGTRYA